MARGNVQKGRLPARSRFGGARSSKAAGLLARGAYSRSLSEISDRHERVLV